MKPRIHKSRINRSEGRLAALAFFVIFGGWFWKGSGFTRA